MSLMIKNFILFQIGWFSCVLAGASSSYTWAGVAMVALIVMMHLIQAANRKNEIFLLLVVTLIGTLWDSMLLLNNLFIFPNGVMVNGLAPHWLIAMWCLFATTLNVSMKWMKGKYFLASIFGAVGGSLAYYAGHRLGAVEFPSTQITILIVAIGWSVIMPLLMAISDRFDGYKNNASTDHINNYQHGNNQLNDREHEAKML